MNDWKKRFIKDFNEKMFYAGEGKSITEAACDYFVSFIEGVLEEQQDEHEVEITDQGMAYYNKLDEIKKELAVTEHALQLACQRLADIGGQGLEAQATHLIHAYIEQARKQLE